MSFSQASASPFWFPDAVLLCALLVTQPRRWPLYILAALPIRLFSEVARDIPTWFLVVTFLIDSAKGLLTAVGLRRFVGVPLRLETLPQFSRYLLIAVVTVPVLGAFAGAAARYALGQDYWTAWDQWFMGDALAQLVLTPAICYWIFGSDLRALAPNTPRRIEAGLLTIGLLVATYFAANTGNLNVPLQQTLFYAPIPFLFWAALRFGMFGAAGAATLFSVIIIQAALQNHGPFAGLPPTETAHALQNFLLLRAAPLYLVAVIVEQRRHVERSLRESEERFRHIANAAPVMIWLVDRERGNEFSNDGWLAFTGRTLQQELGDGWVDGVHSEDKRRVVEAFEAAFTRRERFDIEYRHRRHDGVFSWIHNVGVPRYAQDGAFLGYVGASVDVTDRKRAEEATQALAHAQRLAVLGEVTGMVAHEMRQPLSAILLSAYTASTLLRQREPPVDEVIDIMNSIDADGQRADKTIDAIRAFARKQPSRRENVDLNVVIADVLRLVASDAIRRGVSLRKELAPALPPVMGDPIQLQQVLVNLIVNAMDAQSDIPQSRRYVTISSRLGAEEIEVAVRDGGCGIPPEKMSLLFESFFTDKHQGMGLGLSIARTFVAEHRGRIWVENNPEGGATFRFALPAAESSTQARAASPA
jgi:PAS domain S-box-containing protein